MKIKIILTFLLLANYIFSQVDSSKAVVFIKPQDAIIYLDGKKIESRKELRKISVGVHHIKAWAPKCDLFTDSFIVKKKENKFYSKKLVYTDGYKFYVAKKRSRILTYTVPAILAAGFASTYYKVYMDYDKKINQTYSDALDLQVKYNHSFSPQEFETNYNDYYQKVSDYEDLKKRQKNSKTQGIVISSTLAATAITVFIIQLTRKKTTYQETPLLSKITPGFNPINKQICLTVNLY
jgi:hypothetical protein